MGREQWYGENGVPRSGLQTKLESNHQTKLDIISQSPRLEVGPASRGRRFQLSIVFPKCARPTPATCCCRFNLWNGIYANLASKYVWMGIFELVKSEFSTSEIPPSSHYYKPGGTAMTLTGKWCGRAALERVLKILLVVWWREGVLWHSKGRILLK